MNSIDHFYLPNDKLSSVGQPLNPASIFPAAALNFKAISAQEEENDEEG